MRDIKFRAWNEKNKEFCYSTLKEIWMNGVDVATGTSYDPELFPRSYYMKEEDIKPHMFTPNADWEQYTGLKDFYEGDLVRMSGGDLSEPEIESIAFEDSMFMVGDYSLFFANDNYTLEIIGNIHEGEIPCTKKKWKN